MPAGSPQRLLLDLNSRSGGMHGRVLPLQTLCLDSIAANLDALVDLRGIDPHLVTALLFRIVSKGKLTVRLAQVFIDCGHEEVSTAVSGLDLFNAMPGARDSNRI